MRRLLLAALLGLAFAGRAAAFQSNAGGNAAEFLDIGAGARALGMGEAFATVAEGPEAIYWNPAGLAHARSYELSYSRAEFNRYFHHDYVAAVAPVRFLRGALGASYTRLSQEKLTLVSNANLEVGEFVPHSDAVSLAYATSFDLDEDAIAERDYFGDAWTAPHASRPLRIRDEPWRGRLSIGLALKAVNETVYQRSAHAIAVDGGALFRPADFQNLCLAFAFRNVGTQEKFTETGENLPTEVDFGLGFDARSWRSRWLTSLEAALPYYGNPYGKIGVEYTRPMPNGASFSLRAGYKTLTVYDLSPLSGVTFGLGARVRKVGFDFAVEPAAELGQTFRFTLNVKW